MHTKTMFNMFNTLPRFIPLWHFNISECMEWRQTCYMKNRPPAKRAATDGTKKRQVHMKLKRPKSFKQNHSLQYKGGKCNKAIH